VSGIDASEAFMNRPYVPPANVQQKAERELERLRRALGIEPRSDEWMADLVARKPERSRKRKAQKD
jgi:hypothetical protein